MTFTYMDADKSKTIATFKENKRNGFCYLSYLDKTREKFFCSDEEKQKIRETMINQAIERDEKMSQFLDTTEDLALNIASIISTALFIMTDNDLLFYVTILLIIINIGEKMRKVNELKKYRLYLNMLKEIENVDEEELSRSIEFEKIDAFPLTIDNLDYYSYGQIKRVRKYLDSKKQN